MIPVITSAENEKVLCFSDVVFVSFNYETDCNQLNLHRCPSFQTIYGINREMKIIVCTIRYHLLHRVVFIRVLFLSLALYLYTLLLTEA